MWNITKEGDKSTYNKCSHRGNKIKSLNSLTLVESHGIIGNTHVNKHGELLNHEVCIIFHFYFLVYSDEETVNALKVLIYYFVYGEGVGLKGISKLHIIQWLEQKELKETRLRDILDCCF